jgi:hypothetical protein
VATRQERELDFFLNYLKSSPPGNAAIFRWENLLDALSLLGTVAYPEGAYGYYYRSVYPMRRLMIPDAEKLVSFLLSHGAIAKSDAQEVLNTYTLDLMSGT